MVLSIPQRIIAEKKMLVNYVVTRDQVGNQHYFYVAVRAADMPAFRDTLSNPPFDPEDLGFILEQGDGEADEMTRDKMRMQYGCKHEYAINIPFENRYAVQ